MRALVCRLKPVLNNAVSATGNNVTKRFGHNDGYGGSLKFWERLSYFVAFPAIGLGMLNVYLDDTTHSRPEFIPYSYLRIITKPFPWGNGKRGLFFNPHVNAEPEGYVDEEHH